ncbi:hypothetical protein PPL_09843 [Heterostelium album PN500]|uniref:Uncharacterized protein n=1 Tax=Heterostelium pallidum (strain ATCC 26659 / Pp 5 / PN500) TaxID=670386 RepID=D3BP80_HETP5|nr:hypothetical protein PPL_09843 [Heterostelium album PN500]EFA77090.1 hypothetical protein PPL_09843 [Heterostelium album PN500]|eukprot:XP_020429219.1 hypothetical protein PPL_09843 [Heterostelium album PN500]
MEDKCRIENQKSFEKALARAEPMGKLSKFLFTHEKELLESGKLFNITHRGSTSAWLEAPSSVAPDGCTNVYRPMGDLEVRYLVEHKLLPDTQPYQAIIEGEVGRAYANKYLSGKKWTDTEPSTVVEFTCPKDLIEQLKKIQMKVEDGALSMGLGNKAGGGLPLFNKCLADGTSTFRIVKVKRVMPS